MDSAREVSLAEVLAAREQRAERQRALLARHPGAALICVLVNTPGPCKRLAQSDRVFICGVQAVRRTLADAGIRELYFAQESPATGCEAYLVAEAAPERVKRLLCALEETLPYGRLLDCDVMDETGKPLSRTALAFPARGCMVCGRPGAFCASRRLHALDDILAAFLSLAALAPEEET